MVHDLTYSVSVTYMKSASDKSEGASKQKICKSLGITVCFDASSSGRVHKTEFIDKIMSLHFNLLRVRTVTKALVL